MKGSRTKIVGFAVAAAIVVATIVGVAGSFRGSSDSRLGTATTKPVAISIRLNGPFGPQYAGEIVAARTGVFKQDGINVELKTGGKGQDPIVSVVGGVDTFGVTDSISFLLARSKGEPIVAFAASYLESSVVFYTLERSAISTPQDFIGKRVGRRAETNSAVIYDALLKSTGLSRSSIRESATETDLEALLNGKVDAIPGNIGREGFVLHQRAASFNVIRISDYGIHVPDTIYFTTEKIVRDRPSVVQRVLKGIIAGWNLAYADMARSVSLIASTDSALTPEQVKFMLIAQRDFVKPVARRMTEFDDRQWKQLHSILVGARLLDESIDLSRAINYDFLKEAYRKPISFGN